MPINSVGGPGAAGYGGSTPENEAVATVRMGENTVSDVAGRLGLDVNTMLQANPQIKDPNQKLNAGQELNLPQDPAGTAKGQMQDLSFVKKVEKSSAKLFTACTNGEHFK